MSFRNVTDPRKGEEFALSDRPYPLSQWPEVAGEWRVWLDAKNRKVYTNGLDLPPFLTYAPSSQD
jgi:hypothetical protein